MKILLTVPPFLEEGLEMASKESIGVCYLAAVLRKNGFEVHILDADLLKLSCQETVERICRQRYDLIGFSLLEGTIESTVDIVSRLRERELDAHLVLGGYFSTLATEEILNELPGADSVIRGEGEYPLVELARCIAAGRDWRDLGGVAYRRGEEVVINGNMAACDIDDIPFPARDLLSDVLIRGGVAGVVGSRGCFADCSFCCVNSFSRSSGTKSWRGRSPSKIVDEIQSLVNEWNVDTVSFYDSNFIGPGKAGRMRAYGVAEELMGRGLKINFALCARPDEIEEGLFRTLKKAGLMEVFIGIESMSQRSLDLYEKKTTVEDNRKAVETLEKLEIFYRPGFILYEPFITLDQIKENIKFLKPLMGSRYCRKYHFFKGLRVYRGSPLETTMRNRGLLIRNGWHNSYQWQDPSVVKFIHLTGLVASKMLPLVEKAKQLDPESRNSLDKFLGKWSLNVYEDILDLIQSDDGSSNGFMEVSLQAEERLARVERRLSLVSS